MKITIDFKNVLQTFLKYRIAKNIINIKNTFLKSVNTHIKFKKSEKNIKKTLNKHGLLMFTDVY